MKNLIVEFLGSLILLFSIVASGNPIIIGLTLALIIMMGGKISGGHFNPMVSIAMYLKGKLSFNNLAPYIIAQVGGGIAALELLKLVQ